MTTFQKIHGIQLAGNSWIKNLNIEQLAVDPVDFTGVRVWYNTTAGSLKYSVEDAASPGTFLVKGIYDQESADTANTVLQSTMSAMQTSLSQSIAAEAQARDAADLVLVTAVETEVLARTTAIAALADQVATNLTAGLAEEVVARDAAIAVLAANVTSSIAAESATRVVQFQQALGGLDVIQTELNVTQSGAGLDVNGDYVVVNGSNYISAANSLAEATTLLDTALKAEATDRVSGDSANAAAIAAEALARAAGDAALQTQLEEFVNAAIGSNEIADQVEAAARIAADTAIQTELNATQTGAGLGIDGTFTAPTGTAYIDGATTIVNASVLLDIQLNRVDTALNAEIANRAAGDATVTSAIQAETAARGTAVTALQTELNATQTGAGLETDGTYASPAGSNYLDGTTSLKSAALTLDAAVKAASDSAGLAISTLSTETSRALAAENLLQMDIDGVLSNAISRDAVVKAVADAAAAAAADAIAALSAYKSTVNATRYTFKADSPSTTHAITHGLNSEFISVTIMTQGDDGVFRNDIVPYEEGVDTANEIVISLSDARIIKVSIQRLDQIA